MMLNENSGSPPPRMSSRPRMPVGSCRMVTLSDTLIFFPALRAEAVAAFTKPPLKTRVDNAGPNIVQHPQRQSRSDESHQQAQQFRHQRDFALCDRVRGSLCLEF